MTSARRTSPSSTRPRQRSTFPKGNAIGRRVTVDSATYEIVGVVADTKDHDLRGAPVRRLYLPIYQSGPLPTQLNIRASRERRPGEARHGGAQRASRRAPVAARARQRPARRSSCGSPITQDLLVARVASFFGGAGAGAGRVRSLRRDDVRDDAAHERVRSPHGARRRAAHGWTDGARRGDGARRRRNAHRRASGHRGDAAACAISCSAWASSICRRSPLRWPSLPGAPRSPGICRPRARRGSARSRRCARNRSRAFRAIHREDAETAETACNAGSPSC